MGGELVNSPSTNDDNELKNTGKQLTFKEACWSVFPSYLAIGMTYEQFWFGDVCLTQCYMEAFKLKQRLENEHAWLQGRYVYEAIGALVPVLHAFAKNGTKPNEYLKEPFPMSEQEIKERKERDERLAYERGMQRMKALAESMNKKFKEKESRQEEGADTP